MEDLKTEDFIQSAEISSELKIDSSTVERIDNGQSPNAVVIQFSVGELKAQVSLYDQPSVTFCNPLCVKWERLWRPPKTADGNAHIRSNLKGSYTFFFKSN